MLHESYGFADAIWVSRHTDYHDPLPDLGQPPLGAQPDLVDRAFANLRTEQERTRALSPVGHVAASLAMQATQERLLARIHDLAA